MNRLLLTIGIFGFRPDTFAAALVKHGATGLVDTRQRRGVRGPSYAFANASRLEVLMRDVNIEYISEKRLAPKSAIRDLQKTHDKELSVTKRSRGALSDAFKDAYRADILAHLPDDFADELFRVAGERPALLCVERFPSACHRSIAADWISQHAGVERVDVLPAP